MTALLGLATRLKTARLLLVTDARAATGDLAAFAEEAFAGGVDILQLADPALDETASLGALTTLRSVALRRQRIVAVTSDADLAGEFGADMLVLLDDASSADRARRRLHRYALIGRSCRGTADIDAALADPDVDFLIVTATPAAVRHAAAAAPQGDPEAKPWFAAGGLTAADVGELAAAGCRRVAVSRAITRAADPRAAAAALADALDRAWADDPAMERVRFAAFRSGRLAGAGTRGSGEEDLAAPDAGDGFGSLTNPFKGVAPPPATAPRLPEA
nr:thiamine phosphate synthase [Propionibacterium sp.]